MDIYLILILLGFALSIAGLWRVFEKAGYKGYFTLIPIWNLWIWIKIIDKPKFWLLFCKRKIIEIIHHCHIFFANT